MESYRWESWPWFVLLPIVWAIVWIRTRKRSRPSALYSSIADLKTIPRTMAQRVRSWLPWVYGLGLCCFVLGLARPQSGKSESRIRGEGIAIELVLDVSGSMEALDFQLDGKDVNRLEAVKHVISQFVNGSKELGLMGRRDDLIGAVAFGGFADSKCPLTLDHGALVDIVKGLEVPKPIRDRQGRIINEKTLNEELATAIGDGVALGVDRLRESDSTSKVLILLTDGDNNAGSVDPREAADIAKELGIKIHTIGIGRNDVVPIPQEDEFGRRILVQARFRIDEGLLKDIAEKTGGDYFHASDAEGLARVYSRIDVMEKSKFEELKYAQYSELYRWFAGIGITVVVVIGILFETRFRSLP